VKIIGNGEGAISAWYLSLERDRNNQLAVRHGGCSGRCSRMPSETTSSYDLVLAKLKALNIPPSSRCTDSEFIRRVFLDTHRRVADADEVPARFLIDASPDKRERLVDSTAGSAGVRGLLELQV